MRILARKGRWGNNKKFCQFKFYHSIFQFNHIFDGDSTTLITFISIYFFLICPTGPPKKVCQFCSQNPRVCQLQKATAKICHDVLSKSKQQYVCMLRSESICTKTSNGNGNDRACIYLTMFLISKTLLCYGFYISRFLPLFPLSPFPLFISQGKASLSNDLQMVFFMTS